MVGGEEHQHYFEYENAHSTVTTVQRQQSLLQSFRCCQHYPKITLRGLSAWLLGLISIVTSVVHLFYPAMLRDAVPPYVPFTFLLIGVVGFFQCMGGLGLLIPHLRRPSGWLLAFVVFVTFPANAHLFFDALHNEVDLWRFGLTTAWVACQIVLLLWVYVSSAPWTRPHRKERALYETIQRQRRWAA